MSELFFNIPRSVKKQSIPSCGACKLYQECTTPKMKLSGDGKKKVLIISEAPGSTEDTRGTQLVGSAGEWFRDEVKDILGWNLDRDCWKISAVCCRPPNGRLPTRQEVSYCRPNVESVIASLKPKAILLLGDAAVKSLYEHRTDMAPTIGVYHSYVIPDQVHRAFVIPTYNPTYMLRTMGRKGKTHSSYIAHHIIFKQDLEALVETLDKKVPDYMTEAMEHIVICSSDKEAVERLNKANKDGNMISFDYETSGLDPFSKYSFIYVASVYSRNENVSFSFMVNERTKEALCALLTNKMVGKVGYNNKFEHHWTKRKLGVKVQGWKMDARLLVHCTDNREGVTPLKVQSGLLFGHFGYEMGMNWNIGIKNLPLHDLMKYNALDSWYEWQVYQKLKGVMKLWINDLKEQGGDSHVDGLKLLLEGDKAFTDMEDFGARIDTVYIEKCRKELATKIQEATEVFEGTDLGKLWKKMYGPKMSLSKNKQLSNILFNKMGLKPPKLTDGDDEATDKEALLRLNLEGIPEFLTVRKLVKARNTYLAQIDKFSVDGILHPTISLHNVVTFRSSCSKPNLQNVPMRDPEISNIIRSAFITHSPKGILIEADLKGAEVCLACCHNQDPTLIKYVSDPSCDMHRDTAMRLFGLKKDQVGKTIRYCAKNRFVFPAFYGAQAENAADSIWHDLKNHELPDGTPLKKWLKGQGICSVYDMEERTQNTFDYFWNTMFTGYTQWKEDWFERYLKQGYLDSLTGFRYWGPMAFRDVINYPIQGDAFHLNLWGCVEVAKVLRKQKMRTRLFLQIHDSMIAQTFADEIKEFQRIVIDIYTRRAPERFSWLNVPITVEIEASPVGGSWNQKKGI